MGFEGRGNNDSQVSHCGNLRNHVPQHCLILSVIQLSILSECLLCSGHCVGAEIIKKK